MKPRVLLVLLALLAAAPLPAVAQPALAGHVRYYNGAGPVPGVSVDLQGGTPQSTATDSAGAFAFPTAASQASVLLPHKLGDIQRGVTSLDAARVLQVTTQQATFNAMQALACDVTGNGQVTSLDARRILDLKVNQISRLPVAEACGSDWLFLPQPSAAANQTPMQPLIGGGACTPGKIAYDPLQPPAADQDFTAILFGDCTGNWAPRTRRFSLDPATSLIRTVPGSATTGFTGYLDLTLGDPDPVTGLAQVDLTGASDFLSIDFGVLTLCIHPTVPALNAGVVACNGGQDVGVKTTQDHNIGVVGTDGFTEAACLAAGGRVEQASDPHPGVCNGPIAVTGSDEPDSGAGALLIAPDSRFGTQGIPATLTVAPGPCDQHGPGAAASFGFVSALYRVEILDTNNQPGALFEHDERGENFSCADWTQENGPGRLVLNIGVIHGGGTIDLATVFEFDD